MEGKKVSLPCKNCGEEMVIDFETANFSSQIQIVNGKKQQKRIYIEPCPHCAAMNMVASDNKEEWGSRKGPNIKFFLFSSVFSCFAVIVIGLLAMYFAFKGLGVVMDWLFG